MVKNNNQLIGQLELQIMQYQKVEIGYVNLYYLIPECRGKGIGKKLHQYALDFFKSYQVKEYHLRVAPGKAGNIFLSGKRNERD